MAKPAKERHRETLLNYLVNPVNDWPTRTVMSTVVLGFKHQEHLYNTFTASEIDDIEAEALDLRRRKYAGELSSVDKALIEKAKTGDAQACKLVYQKFEGWAERNEQSGPGGKPIEQKYTVEFINATPKSEPKT